MEVSDYELVEVRVFFFPLLQKHLSLPSFSSLVNTRNPLLSSTYLVSVAVSLNHYATLFLDHNSCSRSLGRRCASYIKIGNKPLNSRQLRLRLGIPQLTFNNASSSISAFCRAQTKPSCGHSRTQRNDLKASFPNSKTTKARCILSRSFTYTKPPHLIHHVHSETHLDRGDCRPISKRDGAHQDIFRSSF